MADRKTEVDKEVKDKEKKVARDNEELSKAKERQARIDRENATNARREAEKK